MRILLTVHQFVPDFHAGTEILTLGAAKALQARGHDVSVLTGFPSQGKADVAPHLEHYVHDGIPVARFHFEPAAKAHETDVIAMEYDNPYFAACFRELLARTRPDVVHFFHLQRLGASAIDVCRELGVPTVLTATDFWLVCPTNQLLLPDGRLCRGPDPDSVNCLRHFAALTQTPFTSSCVNMIPDRLFAAIVNAVEASGLPGGGKLAHIRALRARPGFMRSRVSHVDHITVQTRLMETIFRENGISASRMTLLPFGIDTGGLVRRDAAIPAPILRIGFIGTLSEHKGAHLLVAAARRLDVPVEVRIYGNGGEYPQYMERLRMLAGGDPRIAFCGSFPNAGISDVFASLDVLVVPSIWYENTPLVIYSAQACGCPVIASDLGGLSEVVENEANGLLFEAGNVNELARAIERVARDKDLLRRLGAQAKQPKSIAAYAAELENLYMDILARRRAA